MVGRARVDQAKGDSCAPKLPFDRFHVEPERDAREAKYAVAADDEVVLPMSIGPVVERAQMQATVDLHRERVEVRIDVPPSPVVVEADRLPQWSRKPYPVRDLGEVDLRERIGSAFDVGEDREQMAAMPDRSGREDLASQDWR